ncbi:uncharacterized protein LOC129610331 [Condylostylus longicornis]|uniref:uncharacterized protein LOC129610331 n=1 Tax=Condylostylus longicornis TaxID=2530218 RepID=UPI00244E20E9|nr:uncharacterized protein LOC129610331 [Condylostylus longicornis]
MLKLLIYFVILIFLKISTAYESRPSQFCMNVNPQKGLDIDKILGKWYGNDIIEHAGFSTDPGVYYYDTCAEITIYNVRFANFANKKISSINDEILLLELTWEERGYYDSETTIIEYALQFNRATPGFWVTVDKQKGFSPALKYNQFNGTIQVVKAVKDQLVLTFCGLKLGESFFSIILTRNLQPLPFDDLDSTYKLLRRRGLTTDHVRRVCQPRNNSNTTKSSLIILIVLIFLIFIIN